MTLKWEFSVLTEDFNFTNPYATSLVALDSKLMYFKKLISPKTELGNVWK